MNSFVNFTTPWALLLAPLALLPWWSWRRDALVFSALFLLPHDRAGLWIERAWRAAALLALLGIVIGLAGPGRPETEIARTGRGAEIVVLLDRSLSMDEVMVPKGAQPALYQDGPSQKRRVARDALTQFAERRPDDRFLLMMFGAAPLRVTPFGQHGAVARAGFEAGAIGNGLPATDIGRALVAAAAQFDNRSYTGSRVILLVSDGAAEINDTTRERIRTGLARNRIALYWIYLRSANWPGLDDNPDAHQTQITDVEVHRFFKSLPTPYHAYEAESPDAVARAVAEVDRQQNLPLDFTERVPREDWSGACYLLAALACLGLLVHRAWQIRSWAEEA
jgi:mxaC protein